MRLYGSWGRCVAAVLAGAGLVSACGGEPRHLAPGADPQLLATDDSSPSASNAHGGARIPVLAFHGLCDGPCRSDATYNVPTATFDEMMSGLVSRGYESISVFDYARFLLGEPVILPDKPILITFDDGRTDGYVNADPVLARLGLRAVSFLITGLIEDKRGFYMSWSDVDAAAASGRWDLQLHAHHGHTTVEIGPPDAHGVSPTGPAYAWRRWLPTATGGALETEAEWRLRVSSDLDDGVAALRSRFPTFLPLLFAVPFSDYGESHSNDPAIQHLLRSDFDHGFVGWFTQESADPIFTVRGAHRELHRYEIHLDTTPATLFAWLARHGG